MPSMNCARCLDLFDYDPNDIRPFIYHECKDGKMQAHKNPNLKGQRRTYNKPSTPFKKDKTIWQQF